MRLCLKGFEPRGAETALRLLLPFVTTEAGVGVATAARFRGEGVDLEGAAVAIVEARGVTAGVGSVGIEVEDAAAAGGCVRF